MTETALKLVETDGVKTKSLTIVEQSRAIKIVDAETYKMANYMYKALTEMLKEIENKCDKNISLWHKGHQNALDEKREYYNPVDQERRNKKKEIDDYKQEQERIRLAEQQRLEKEARKAEEERRLLEAIEAEEEAKANGLTSQEAAQEAEAILQKPTFTPPVVLPKTNFVPKINGGPNFREIWAAEVVSIKELCRGVAEGTVSPECVMGNMPVLNKMATALKQTMNVRGVRAISRRV